MLSTLRKSGRVLDLFDAQHPERGVSEVAQTLGLPKSTTHALLSTLTEVGLLRRTPNARYRLGWKLLGLSYALVASAELLTEARPITQDLVHRYGESVHLAVLDGDMVTYVDKVQGTQAIQIAVTWVGSRLPAHCSGVGKVLLAARPWTEVAEILERQGMRALTPNTIRTPERLRAELERTAAQGYAYDLEEAVVDLCCVAAPIRDHTSSVVAALSLSVPAYRFHRQREAYRDAVVAAARQISRSMGHAPDGPRERDARRPGRAGTMPERVPTP
jgi:IclR family transcriptional regulator, KDG regulon repressor